jgi:YD repeat-containing protein
VTASYTYDGLERMAIRTTSNMTPAGTTHYIYDLAGHLIAEATSTGTTVREYVWLDDTPVAVYADLDTASPNFYYVHVDHLNRPILMTDGSRAVVWRATYKPFGAVQAITGSASNNLRFPGAVFPDRGRAALQLAPALRPDARALYAARSAGVCRWTERVCVCAVVAAYECRPGWQVDRFGHPCPVRRR